MSRYHHCGGAYPNSHRYQRAASLPTQVGVLDPDYMALRRLANIKARARYLKPDIQFYPVHGRRDFVQDVYAPLERDIYVPIIQPHLHQRRPVIEQHLTQRIRPVLHEDIVPVYSNVDVAVRNAPPRFLEPSVRQEDVSPLIYRHLLENEHRHRDHRHHSNDDKLRELKRLISQYQRENSGR